MIIMYYTLVGIVKRFSIFYKKLVGIVKRFSIFYKKIIYIHLLFGGS